MITNWIEIRVSLFLIQYQDKNNSSSAVIIVLPLNCDLKEVDENDEDAGNGVMANL